MPTTTPDHTLQPRNLEADPLWVARIPTDEDHGQDTNHQRPDRISQPRVMPWSAGRAEPELLLAREWLVTNGLGGYASGTIAGAVTRQFHGLLIAALPAPAGRIVMWSHLADVLRFGPGDEVSLGGEERSGGRLDLSGAEVLREFRLENGLPVWLYEVRGLTIEKRILMPHRQNTVLVRYRISGAGKLPQLDLRPTFNFRHYADSVGPLPKAPYQMQTLAGRSEVRDPEEKFPALRMRLSDCEGRLLSDPRRMEEIFYRTAHARGHSSEGELWSPGIFRVDLEETGVATLIGSTEEWNVIEALTPEETAQAEQDRRGSLLAQSDAAAHDAFAAELVLAADQFIITPAGRGEEIANRDGEEACTIIAGYHWFTDWGRDTMISLEGLTLTTGRAREARCILRTFARYVRNGLIPNMFPDGQNAGLYHTADATLWFFHALHRYLQATNDRATLALLLPTLGEIIAQHLAGTDFNIRVDPDDGLLSQGEEGYQLTWMDAKVGDWVVTPRRGKAVEINALWFNALALMATWAGEVGDQNASDGYARQAERARHSFQQRFWIPERGYLYDVIDGPEGNDDSLRPNQVFAISLDHPVLAPERWAPVLAVVEKELLTPVGLRSLAPAHPAYKKNYHGDLQARDAAYHQGTIWAWLIGPFLDAWLKLHPNELEKAHTFLDAFPAHLSEAGIGTISEVFDADEPHTARGCIAQAWSVAEVLRCWVKTSPPPPERPIR